MYEVFKVDSYGELYIFKGSKKEAKVIYEVLSDYYAYHLGVEIVMEKEQILEPEYKNLEEFLLVPEYQYHFDDLFNKNKKYSAYSSDLGTKYFDTIEECDTFIENSAFGSLSEIRYTDTGELVETEIPF